MRHCTPRTPLEVAAWLLGWLLLPVGLLAWRRRPRPLSRRVPLSEELGHVWDDVAPGQRRAG